MDEYERLERETSRVARVSDHRAAWDQLEPLLLANGTKRAPVEAWARAKGVSLDALIALNTRLKINTHGGIELAWPSMGTLDGREIVTAVKFRPLDPERKRYALTPSVFVHPNVLGRRDSLDWFVAEGETDAARLYDLVGDSAAILVLPAGAATFKPEWAKPIPRGARVFLAHDADEAGDKGAEKAARLIGGRTTRLRPPEEAGDWCAWRGTREEFVELVQAVGNGGDEEVEPLNLSELLAGPVPAINWLWRRWLGQGELAILVAAAGTGKSILSLLLACAVRQGGQLLGDECSRGNAGVIDVENPLQTVHLRLRLAGVTAEDHAGLVYFHFPAIDVCSPAGEAFLRDTIEKHGLRLLVLDSFRRIAPGVDENDSAAVSAFFAPLRRVTVATDCSILVLHHPKKRQNDGPTEATELVRGSGDFTAAVDTLLFARPKPPDAFTLEGFGKRTGTRHDPILVRLSPPESETLYLTNEGDVAFAEDKVEATLARIVKALEDDGGTLDRPEIAIRIDSDVGNGTFRRALKLGFQRQLLAKSERKVGEPTAYSLAPGEYK